MVYYGIDGQFHGVLWTEELLLTLILSHNDFLLPAGKIPARVAVRDDGISILFLSSRAHFVTSRSSDIAFLSDIMSSTPVSLLPDFLHATAYACDIPHRAHFSQLVGQH